MGPVTNSVLRLLAISVALATALPATSALAGWRDGPYYADDGWGGDYYPPARAYRPDYDQPDDDYGQRPWAGRRQAYAPYYEEPYYDDRGGMAPTVRPRVLRPPRNVAVMPVQPRRLAPVKPKPVMAPSIRKVEPARTATAEAPAPAVKSAPVSEAKVLPVPRPNLESMDFDSAAPPAK
jgi:hypothetical protein